MVEKDIKLMRAYTKRLSSICFTMMTNKDGTVRVRLGKKYIIVGNAPNKEVAEVLAAELSVVVDKHRAKIETILEHLEAHCEQLTLGLQLPQEIVQEDVIPLPGKFIEMPSREVQA